MWRRGGLILAVMLCVSCWQRPARRPRIQALAIKKPSGSLGLEYETTTEKRTFDGGETRVTDGIFSQTLELETEGYVFHPKLVEFAMSGLIGFTQEEYEEEDEEENRSSTGRGDLLEFDLAADILREKLFPIRAYASRRDQVVPRRFAPSISLDDTRYGAIVRWADLKTPMALSFNHESIVENSDTEIGASQTDTWYVAYNVRAHLGSAGVLSLNLNHSTTSEDVYDTEVETDTVDIRHDVFLDSDNHHRLVTDIRYFEDKGDVPQRDFDYAARLVMDHTESFSTEYEIDYDYTEREQQTQEYYEAGAGFTHELFESLTTSAGVNISEKQTDSGLTSSRQGGNVTLNYRKRTRLGTLFLGAAANHRTTDVTGATTTLFTIDERHRLSDSAPAVLIHTDVVRTSIVVTDTDRNRLAEGLDYSITEMGNRIGLRYVPGGEIDVLVSYRHVEPGDNRTTELTTRWHASHAFSFGFTPYIRVVDRSVTIRPKRLRLLENDESIVTIGAEQKLGRLTLDAERRTVDSASSPYNSTSFGANYFITTINKARINMTAAYSDLQFTEEPTRETQIWSLAASAARPISRALSITCSAEYRDENDSDIASTESFVGRAGLSWAFRAFRFNADVEYSQTESETNTNENTWFFFRLERLF